MYITEEECTALMIRIAGTFRYDSPLPVLEMAKEIKDKKKENAKNVKEGHFVLSDVLKQVTKVYCNLI